MTNYNEFELPAINANDYDLDARDLRAAQFIIEREFTPRTSKEKRLTYQEIAEEMSIDRDTLLAIRKKDEFQRYIKDVSHAMLAEKAPALVQRLMELALGSPSQMPGLKAVLAAMEVAGFYSPRGNDVNVNVKKDDGETITDEQLAAIAAKYADIDND